LNKNFKDSIKDVDWDGLERFYSEGAVSWFDQNRYDQISNYSANDWLTHLAYFKMMLDAARDKDKEARSYAQVNFYENVVDNPGGLDLHVLKSFNEDLYVDWKYPTVFSPVVSSLIDELDILENLADADGDAVDSEEFLLQTPEQIISKYSPSDSRILGASEFRLAHVYLHAPDAEIMDDFRSWLKELRVKLDQNTPKPYYSSKSFRSWHEQRIIPFLDLYLWEELGNNVLTDATYGELLFPDEFAEGGKGRDNTELIRKTTRKKALRLISAPALGGLKRYVNMSNNSGK